MGRDPEFEARYVPELITSLTKAIAAEVKKEDECTVSTAQELLISHAAIWNLRLPQWWYKRLEQRVVEVCAPSEEPTESESPYICFEDLYSNVVLLIDFIERNAGLNGAKEQDESFQRYTFYTELKAIAENHNYKKYFERCKELPHISKLLELKHDVRHLVDLPLTPTKARANTARAQKKLEAVLLSRRTTDIIRQLFYIELTSLQDKVQKPEGFQQQLTEIIQTFIGNLFREYDELAQGNEALRKEVIRLRQQIQEGTAAEKAEDVEANVTLAQKVQEMEEALRIARERQERAEKSERDLTKKNAYLQGQVATLSEMVSEYKSQSMSHSEAYSQSGRPRRRERTKRRVPPDLAKDTTISEEWNSPLRHQVILVTREIYRLLPRRHPKGASPNGMTQQQMAAFRVNLLLQPEGKTSQFVQQELGSLLAMADKEGPLQRHIKQLETFIKSSVSDEFPEDAKRRPDLQLKALGKLFANHNRNEALIPLGSEALGSTSSAFKLFQSLYRELDAARKARLVSSAHGSVSSAH